MKGWGGGGKGGREGPCAALVSATDASDADWAQIRRQSLPTGARRQQQVEGTGGGRSGTRKMRGGGVSALTSSPSP